MGLFDNIFRKKKTEEQPRIKGKNPEAFDTKEEKLLLSQYKKYKGRKNSFEYFSALPLIDFYYKFRNLDEKYLDECIYYCNLCISLMDARDMQDDIKHGIVLPAFRKLIIIYENKGQYQEAIQTAKNALKYSKYNENETEYYQKRIKKIEQKLKKSA
jgi:tetratricopeptide (TPR) repeat protein